MKKALLTIFVLALAASAGYAQTEKGSMYISGKKGACTFPATSE